VRRLVQTRLSEGTGHFFLFQRNVTFRLTIFHRRMKSIIITLLIASLLPSCHQEHPDPTPTPTPPFNREYELQRSPEAIAAYDGSNYGIYKGVVINAEDSSATLQVNLYNNSRQPYVLFYTNHKLQDSLLRYKKDNSGYMLIPQVADSSTIPVNSSFYSTYFSSYSIGHGTALVGFNVSAFGKNYVLDARLNANACLNAMLKEKSNNQVNCYEGSYSGSDSGRIAFVMSTDSIVAIRASVWNPQFFKLVTAHVSNGSFALNQVDDVSGNTFLFIGNVQNNVCAGTWTKSSAPTVVNSFKAMRTL
jgi:hypothetical protein